MSSNSSDFIKCFQSGPLRIFSMCFNVFNLLTLPLFFNVLYIAYRQTRRRRSAAAFPSSSGPAVSHSDMFTFHMAAMDVIGALASLLRLYGLLANKYKVIAYAFYIFYFMWYGEVMFHSLTCLDRYLAAVHPITYMGLRQGWALKLRSVVIASVWLISSISTYLAYVQYSSIVAIVFLTLILIVIAFCSLSVLCVLIRKGPGSQSASRMDPNKRRAFKSILIILTVLLLRYTWSLTTSVYGVIVSFNHVYCLFAVVELVAWVPGTLVLPVLFLYKRWTCSKHSTR
ncbi:uncharacterized protein LOC109511868 [Hippocampus comes]|uniref:uncharacterized protein LOC109511868 n=1 Tax=Hippocampus comes TaxID=109280 RepID=UPI00094E5BCC|nr:PREDICTED: uncharacterized protein LOC109511868 [Hippocampus comes]